MAWYDFINPFAGRDIGSKADYQVPGFADRDAITKAAAANAYGPGGRDANAGAEFRQNQVDVLARLKRMMNGEDSQSAAELSKNYGTAASQQLALAGSARPQNAAMAARNAAQNISGQQSGLAGEQALAGIAERNAATQSYLAGSGAARGQDMALLGQNDAYGNANNALNLQNATAQQSGNQAFYDAQAKQPSPWERTQALISGIAKGSGAFGKGDDKGVSGGDAAKLAGLAAGVPMAKGGVVTRPTHILAGEAGPEVIIPLKHLPVLMKQINKAKVNDDTSELPKGEYDQDSEELWRSGIDAIPQSGRDEAMKRSSPPEQDYTWEQKLALIRKAARSQGSFDPPLSSDVNARPEELSRSRPTPPVYRGNALPAPRYRGK